MLADAENNENNNDNNVNNEDNDPEDPNYFPESEPQVELPELMV